MARYQGQHEDYIIELFEESNGNATRATEIYEEEKGKRIDKRTVLVRWRRANLVSHHSHGGHRHGVSEGTFKKIHKDCKGNGIDIMKITGLSRRTTVNRLYKYKLPFHNLSTYFPKKKQISDWLGIYI